MIREKSEPELNIARRAARPYGYSTGAKLKEVLGDIEWFKDFDDKDWAEFGEVMKHVGSSAAVFSGAVAGFFKYHARGFGFPATREYIKDKKALATAKYTSDVVLDILDRANVLDVIEVNGSDVISSVFFSPKEKEVYSQRPRKRFPVFFYNEVFVEEMRKFVKKHGLPIKLESVINFRVRVSDLAEQLGLGDGYDRYSEVAKDLEAKFVDMRPTLKELSAIGEFKRQYSATYGGINKIMRPCDFWETVARQCETVADCVRMLNAAIDEQLPGLQDFFQKRAIELANINQWGAVDSQEISNSK